MRLKFERRAVFTASAAMLLLAAMMVICPYGAWAQTSNLGSVSVTVTDPTGAVVPSAALELRDLATNYVRRAETQANGAYTFPDLPIGTYQLRITAQGFQTQIFESVIVQAARMTSVSAQLQLGSTTEAVTVSASETPLVQPESSVLASTIETKNIVNLPIVGRNVMSMAFLVPGWAGRSAGSADGTWNNLPGGAVVSADFDGTPGISNRFRSGGFQYGTTVVQPRMENVAEMTIQTAQIDLSGTGTSAMRIAVVTRRGTNQFHGRLYEDHRNVNLEANSWINNARGLPRGPLILNDFGGNIGGPILKDKLFFFFAYSQSIQPQTNSVSTSILSPDAQKGLFSYRDSTGAIRTIDLMQIAGNAGYRTTVHPNISQQFSVINSSLKNGVVVPTSDPNIYTLAFQQPARNNFYWPSIRADYNFSDDLRFYASYSQQKNTFKDRYTEQFPGVDPINKTSSGGNNRIAGLGFSWVINPTLINQFHAGYMYQYSYFSPENLGLDYSKIHRQNWSYGTSLYGSAYPRRAISSFYPLINAQNSLTWMKGSHNFTFGGSWYREQDHYWNGPGGEPNYNFGIVSQDPLSAVFNTALSGIGQTNLTNAQNLYAILTGRVSSVTIGVGRPLDPKTRQYKPFGAYNLNEVIQHAGFWFQDRWKLTPNFTLNYGIRWDIVGDVYNVDGLYSTLPTLGDLFGPTPVGAYFQPGKLGGVANPVFKAQQHVYGTTYKNFSPAVAIAWVPQIHDGFLGRLVGGDKTVIRAGYSLRFYTEGAQNYWAFASNSGQFFFQQGSLSANPTPAVGNFVPGSLTLGDPLPNYLLSPEKWSEVVPAADLFARTTFWGLNPNIRQPYVEQWNLGIQRQIGSSAIEVRYVGNLSLRQWLGFNINEINIFENGFLQEFLNARQNLAINRANGRGNNFRNNGLPGQVPLPILENAFGTATSNFGSGTYVNYLDNGAAGSFANALANNATFYCNMVGTPNMPACASRGVNVPGAGYPLNFWQVNPYATGRAVNYLDSSGMSNYHGLQVEFRQRPTHGMQFNMNYTWAKSMARAVIAGIQGQGNDIYYTVRNFRLNYEPSPFDIRHVLRVYGTYDLPFGKGRPFLNNGDILDRIVGGWTIGTITTIQSGNRSKFSGGYGTVNTNDSGIVMKGITVADLQDAVGVYKGGNPWVGTVESKFVASNGAANSQYFSPNTTPGLWGYRPIVYGPGWYNVDLSVTKSIPIREAIRLTLQSTFSNAFNHPTFNLGDLNIQSLSFGQSTGGPTGRRIVQLRANIEF